MDFEYAFLLDALLEEQEQNITIDTTQIQFRTKARNYVIVDAPGHKEFLKNMITGAASADAAIVLLDAREGLQEQTRRHGYLLSLLGVKQVLVAVNKMDLVEFSHPTFNDLERDYRAFLEPYGITPLHFIPMSAKHGHNIVKPSEHMPWFKGPTLLAALDHLQQPPAPIDRPLRFIVQDIYRFDERRLIAGRIESGQLKTGDELVFWPDRKKSKIKSIEAWPAEPKQNSRPGGTIDCHYIGRTDFRRARPYRIACRNSPVEGHSFSARVFWLHDEPLHVGQNYTLKLATQQVEARLVRIDRLMDSATLTPLNESRLNIGGTKWRNWFPRAPTLAFDNSDVVQETGASLSCRRTHRRRRRYFRLPVRTGGQCRTQHPYFVTDDPISHEARIDHFGHRGAVIWMTGLSGSGKSTLATALQTRLFRQGYATTLLDGDNLRHGLCSDLGFSTEDRSENIRRAAEAAKLLAEAGLVVIAALISPLVKDREMHRPYAARRAFPSRKFTSARRSKFARNAIPSRSTKKRVPVRSRDLQASMRLTNRPPNQRSNYGPIFSQKNRALSSWSNWPSTSPHRDGLPEDELSGFSI